MAPLSARPPGKSTSLDRTEQMFYTIRSSQSPAPAPGSQTMKLAHILIPDFPIQVEILGDPSLRQKPVVIGGRPGEEGSGLGSSPAAPPAGGGVGRTLLH